MNTLQQILPWQLYLLVQTFKHDRNWANWNASSRCKAA